MRDKELDSILKEVNNKNDPIVKIASERQPVEVLSTGSIALDRALGVGGLPKGRIVEIYGPEASGKTTVTLGMIAEAQRRGIRCAFLDMEHALTPNLVTGCGVDIDQLLFAQPNYGEQCLQLAERLVETGKIGVVVIDSVAALIPKAELDGEMEDNQIGAQARMIGKGVRKLVGSIHDNNVIFIFINQIREKVGVMFGCLHADNLINFTNGECKTIKDIVENKIEGRVWSYDEGEGFIESNIVDWHYNGEVDDKSDYISINIKGPGNKNGRMNITITPDHEVLTDMGFIRAENLSVGDKLITKQPKLMSGSYGKFLAGVLSGDSHISNINGHFCSSLVIKDNVDIEYSKWKVNLLSSYAGMDFRCNGSKYLVYTSNQHYELTVIKNKYPNRDPNVLFDNYSWIGFAIWILDDACYNRDRYTLSIRRFKGDFNKINDISRRLDDLGLWHHKSYSGRIVFDKDVSSYIASNIYKFVPECMRHKIPIEYHKHITNDIELVHDGGYVTCYPEIVSMREASGRQMRNIGKYDISVDNNCHNYMAGGMHNGVIVHNSPEVTPGGRAIKFASSIRLEVKRRESITSGKKIIGNNLRIKVVKNKVDMPNDVADVELYFGKGIDNSKDFINVAVDVGIVTKNGSFYCYKNIKSNGSANFLKDVKENDLYDEIEKETRAKMIEEVNNLDDIPVSSDDDSDDNQT